MPKFNTGILGNQDLLEVFSPISNIKEYLDVKFVNKLMEEEFEELLKSN